MMYLNHNDYSQNIKELKRTIRLFNKNKILICLHSGTLLGAVRERDFIKSDNDIDILYVSNKNTLEGVLNEFNTVITPLLIKNGYTIEPQYWSMLEGNPLMLGQYHIIKNGITLDLWVGWFDKDDKFYASCCIAGELTKEEILPLSQVTLHNSLYNAPKNCDKFLTTIYNTWRIPCSKGLQANPYFYKKD